jgi:RNA methyltransferase, TrmH family
MSYPNELSFTHPHVQRLRRLVGRRSSRVEEQSFVIEGVKTLTEALDAKAGVLAVFADADFKNAVVDRCEAAGLVVHRLAPGVIERVADTVSPQPIMAVVETPATTLADLRTLLRDGGFVLVCVEIRDPGNAGTVIRSAEAAGAVGVVFTDDSVEVTNPKTVRASAGAVFHIPVVSGVSVVELAAAFESWGVRSWATEARSPTSTSLDDADLTGPTAIVMGNEAHGFSPEQRALFMNGLSIEMVGRTESLNLSMAATLVCFEAARQRRTAAAVPKL